MQPRKILDQYPGAMDIARGKLSSLKGCNTDRIHMLLQFKALLAEQLSLIKSEGKDLASFAEQNQLSISQKFYSLTEQDNLAQLSEASLALRNTSSPHNKLIQSIIDSDSNCANCKDYMYAIRTSPASLSLLLRGTDDIPTADEYKKALDFLDVELQALCENFLIYAYYDLEVRDSLRTPEMNYSGITKPLLLRLFVEKYIAEEKKFFWEQRILAGHHLQRKEYDRLFCTVYFSRAKENMISHLISLCDNLSFEEALAEFRSKFIDSQLNELIAIFQSTDQFARSAKDLERGNSNERKLLQQTGAFGIDTEAERGNVQGIYLERLKANYKSIFENLKMTLAQYYASAKPEVNPENGRDLQYQFVLATANKITKEPFTFIEKFVANLADPELISAVQKRERELRKLESGLHRTSTCEAPEPKTLGNFAVSKNEYSFFCCCCARKKLSHDSERDPLINKSAPYARSNSH